MSISRGDDVDGGITSNDDLNEDEAQLTVESVTPAARPQESTARPARTQGGESIPLNSRISR